MTSDDLTKGLDQITEKHPDAADPIYVDPSAPIGRFEFEKFKCECANTIAAQNGRIGLLENIVTNLFEMVTILLKGPVCPSFDEGDRILDSVRAEIDRR